MSQRTKIVDIDMSQPIPTLTDLQDYRSVQVLVRLYGKPLGTVTLPVIEGRVDGAVIQQVALEQFDEAIQQTLVSYALANPIEGDGLSRQTLLNAQPPPPQGERPLVSVVVVARRNARDLRECLVSVQALDYPNLEVLVIDNAPATEATRHVVEMEFPNVRYIEAPYISFSAARNRGITETNGDIIAFTDDSAVVDPAWISTAVATFNDSADVMCVTGLVLPHRLDADMHYLQEAYFSLGRGFQTEWYRRIGFNKEIKRLNHYRPAKFGSGVNMVFRRELFERIGGFNPALGRDTAARGGDDLEMFFRVLHHGYTLVYEPSALVRYRHCDDHGVLTQEVEHDAYGTGAFLRSVMRNHPDKFWTCIKALVLILWSQHLAPMLTAYVVPTGAPRDLLYVSMVGIWNGLRAYPKSVQGTSENTLLPEYGAPITLQVETGLEAAAIALRTVELSAPLQPLTGVDDYNFVRLVVTLNKRLVGWADLDTYRQSVSTRRLREAIAAHIGAYLIDYGMRDLPSLPNWDKRTLRWHTLSPLERLPVLHQTQAREMLLDGVQVEAVESMPQLHLPDDVPVSVVVTTYDRPDDLDQCLQALRRLDTRREVEIVVVDNHPSSGKTSPIVEKYPGVVLVSETRQGSSQGRNAGFRAASHTIIAVTDDDMQVDAQWLERLVRHFAREEVMVVTGNVLPIELETRAQRLFERFASLGRGMTALEVNKGWFNSFRRAVPVYKVGATANIALRRDVFEHPQVGYLDERFGAGVPTGGGEDMMLLYKVLRANMTLVYEPTAFGWHRHRRSMQVFYRQIRSYHRGTSAMYWVQALQLRDLRALYQLVFVLPVGTAKQFARFVRDRLTRRLPRPLRYTLAEFVGYLTAPYGLVRAIWFVRHQPPSDPTVRVMGEADPTPDAPSTETIPEAET